MPERTFCAVPDTDHPAHRLFSRQVIAHDVGDEVEAHVGMFRPDKNAGYARMTGRAEPSARELEANLHKRLWLPEPGAVGSRVALQKRYNRHGALIKNGQAFLELEAEVRALARLGVQVVCCHVPREENQEADSLAAQGAGM